MPHLFAQFFQLMLADFFLSFLDNASHRMNSRVLSLDNSGPYRGSLRVAPTRMKGYIYRKQRRLARKKATRKSPLSVRKVCEEDKTGVKTVLH
jgi:hypothetical protein